LSQTFSAPLLTEDDAFNSNPEAGFISYRVPSLTKLMGVPDEFVNQYGTMTFTIDIDSNDSLLGQTKLRCYTTSACQLRYVRAYTPVIYELSPPVVYHNAEALVYFDPKSTTSLIKDLESDEMAFINVKIGGVLMDFEDSVTSTRGYSHYYRN
jgi:hypothetical protein